MVKSPSPDLTRLPAFSKLPAGPPPLRKRVVAPASAAISRVAPGALRKTAPLLKRRSAPLLRTLAPELLVWVRVRPSMVVVPLMERGPASSTGPLPARVPPEKERPCGEGGIEAEIEAAAVDLQIGQAVGGGADEVEASVAGHGLEGAAAGEDGVLEGACAVGEGQRGAVGDGVGAGVGAAAGDGGGAGVDGEGAVVGEGGEAPPPLPVLAKSPSPDLTRLPAFSKLPAGPPPLRTRWWRRHRQRSREWRREHCGRRRRCSRVSSAPLVRTLAPELLVWVRVRPIEWWWCR